MINAGTGENNYVQQLAIRDVSLQLYPLYLSEKTLKILDVVILLRWGLLANRNYPDTVSRNYYRPCRQAHSSFPVIHKVGNVVKFVLLRSEG